MDFRDIFRSFFGFRNDRNEDNFWNRNSIFDENQNNNQFSNDFEEMNRDFEDMFQSFGHIFNIINNFSHFDNKNIIEFNDSNEWRESDDKPKRDPRDLMLRESQNEMKDIDYDEKVRNDGLNALINDKLDYGLNAVKSPVESKFIRKSYFYSSSINNGRVEEQKVTKDGFGNEETSVTQRIGDKSFTKVIKRNKNNIIEENEMLSNLSEDELKDFMKEWNKTETNTKPLITTPDNYRNSTISPNDSLLKRIFNFSFKF